MNPFSFFDGIVCINLPERADRREACVEEFKKLGLETSPPSPLLEERGEATRAASYEFFQGIYSKPGEMKWQGCKNSHLAVIKMAKERGWKSVLIFEDDMVVKEKEMEYYKQVIESLPYDWWLFYLGGNPFEKLTSPPAPLLQERGIADAHLLLCKGVKCAHAYAVHELAYNYILNEAPQQDIPIDRFYKNDVQPLGSCLIADRFCVGQRPGYSNILGFELDYSYMERKFFEAITGRVPIPDPYEGRNRKNTPKNYKPVG